MRFTELLKYLESLLDMVTSFYAITVLVHGGEVCKLCDYRQSSILKTLETVTKDEKCTIKAEKWSKFDTLSNTDRMLHALES